MMHAGEHQALQTAMKLAAIGLQALQVAKLQESK